MGKFKKYFYTPVSKETLAFSKEQYQNGYDKEMDEIGSSCYTDGLNHGTYIGFFTAAIGTIGGGILVMAYDWFKNRKLAKEFEKEEEDTKA